MEKYKIAYRFYDNHANHSGSELTYKYFDTLDEVNEFVLNTVKYYAITDEVQLTSIQITKVIPEVVLDLAPLDIPEIEILKNVVKKHVSLIREYAAVKQSIYKNNKEIKKTEDKLQSAINLISEDKLHIFYDALKDMSDNDIYLNNQIINLNNKFIELGIDLTTPSAVELELYNVNIFYDNNDNYHKIYNYEDEEVNE